MHHIAIDLGSRQSQICVRRPDASIEWEDKIDTHALPQYFGEIQQDCRIVMETCSEAMALSAAARECGHDVRLVPSTLSRQLGVGSRGIKTDKRDARALSEASCRLDLPSIHIRGVEARQRSSKITARAAMVSARTLLVNSVRGWLRSQLVRVTGTPPHLGQRVRQKFAAQEHEVPSYIEQLLCSIEGLSTQITQADSEIERLAKQDEECKRLMTIPGVGPLTSLCFVAIVEKHERFASAHQLESYLGLTPGENSSSLRQRRTGITKAGPAVMRHLLTQASLTLRRVRPEDPIAIWAGQVGKRRGKQIATVATARKLAGIMYAMCRDGSVYDGELAASRLQSGGVLV